MEFLKAIPALPGQDMVEATEYYRERLGFSIGYTDGSFGIVT